MPTRDPAEAEALAAILERVRAAKGPSRELDARIWAECDGRDIVVLSSATWSNALFGRYRQPPHDECFLWSSRGAWNGLPLLTDSIDAARALVTRVLPGTMWATGSMEAGPFCRLVYPRPGGTWGEVASLEQEGGPPTEPLAILAALLTAKLTLTHQEASHVGR